MNKFAEAIIRMSESTMENSGYVRGLLRAYDIPVPRKKSVPKD